MVVFAVLLAISLVSSAVVNAAPGKDTIITAVNVLTLEPVVNLETALDGITLGEITLTEMSDGSRKVGGKASFPIDGNAYAFQLRIDPDARTYTIARAEPDQSLVREVDAQVMGDLALGPLSGDVGISQVHRVAGVTLLTTDPAPFNEPLARTSVYLHWKEYPGGLVEYYTREKGTWAANPTRFFTHWYLLAENWNGAAVDNGFNVWSNRFLATYYNTDFASDAITLIGHEAQVWGMAGSYDVDFHYTHEGDLAWFLNTYVSQYFQ